MVQPKNEVERVAWDLISDAKKFMGAGWDHVSPSIQRALVMERVLSVVMRVPRETEAAATIGYGRDLIQAVNAWFDRT